jgi:hypothetical protein
MRFTTLLTSLALTAGTAHAVAETMVRNKCSFSVYYAAVDSTTPSSSSELPPGSYAFEAQWYDGKTGTALKITKTSDGIWMGRPVLNFGYTVNESEVWYDISAINGFDFWGQKIELKGDREDAEEIVWDGEPGPVHVAHEFGELDLVLTLCA